MRSRKQIREELLDLLTTGEIKGSKDYFEQFGNEHAMDTLEDSIDERTARLIVEGGVPRRFKERYATDPPA